MSTERLLVVGLKQLDGLLATHINKRIDATLCGVALLGGDDPPKLGTYWLHVAVVHGVGAFLEDRVYCAILDGSGQLIYAGCIYFEAVAETFERSSGCEFRVFNFGRSFLYCARLCRQSSTQWTSRSHPSLRGLHLQLACRYPRGLLPFGGLTSFHWSCEKGTLVSTKSLTHLYLVVKVHKLHLAA